MRWADSRYLSLNAKGSEKCATREETAQACAIAWLRKLTNLTLTMQALNQIMLVVSATAFMQR